jgi:hypothetical protein
LQQSQREDATSVKEGVVASMTKKISKHKEEKQQANVKRKVATNAMNVEVTFGKGSDNNCKEGSNNKHNKKNNNKCEDGNNNKRKKMNNNKCEEESNS